MKKSNIFLIILVVILVAILIILTREYFILIKQAKTSFDSALSNADLLYEANKKVQELEDELEQYRKSSIITSVTNDVTDNQITSTESYIPAGMDIADPNDNSGVKAPDLKFDRSPENVTIEVLKNTITNTSVEILITDNNKDYYGWGVDFKVQKKVNSKWETLPYISDGLAWNSIAYVPNENNQLKQKLNIEAYYGKLEKGTYRILKQVYENEYIDLYSDEFEIK